MHNCKPNMLVYFNEVGFDMSDTDLNELLVELKIRESSNGIMLNTYKNCVEIDKNLKKLIKEVAAELDARTPVEYPDWVLNSDCEELELLGEELRFFSKLYAGVTSNGNVELADKINDCMDSIMNRMGRK